MLSEREEKGRAGVGAGGGELQVLPGKCPLHWVHPYKGLRETNITIMRLPQESLGTTKLASPTYPHLIGRRRGLKSLTHLPN